MATHPAAEAESLIQANVYGSLGHLMLNRPGKLNALTHQMLLDLHHQLTRWAEDRRIQAVVITGAGQRGFCAGGDIADFHAAVTGGRHEFFHDLLANEFDTDHLISTYPKPVITMAHGITMGGGIGLASHAPVRLVTASARMGMPEAKIGYSPDVGGTHLLAQMPGHFGEYYAMSADSFTGADAPYLGFADVVVGEDFAQNILDHIEELVGLDAGQIAAAVQVMHGEPESLRLELDQGWVDHAFSAPTPEEVMANLAAMKHPGAQKAYELIRGNSPTSVASAFYAVRAARAENNLRSALDRELRLADYLMHRADLAEGIRAQVIDKDRNPSWQPAELEKVDQQSLLAVLDPADV